MAVERFDAIVLGLGGMGSAALYHLAQRGVKVCGVERHGVAHDRGSSHGEARVIRRAYYEHPDYVPLLNRAYDLWHEAERASERQLLVECGVLMAGPIGGESMAGLEACYNAHDLPHERISGEEACARYPQFRLEQNTEAFFDPHGGYLHVERCVEQHIELAERHGAQAYIHEEARAWRADDSGVSVTTEHRELQADRLIICAGAWAEDALADLKLPLRILRKVQLWYSSLNIEVFERDRFPVFFVEKPYGCFYGFPAFTPEGLKIAEHTGGFPVSDPDALDRALYPEDEQGIRRFLQETIPGFQPTRTQFSVCMYTSTTDEHFILDQHPAYPNVALAAGFSGHGFKFASVVGEVLADLAQHGDTQHPIDFLRLNRFSEVGA
jgi:sarcosine oxidase